MSHLTPDQILEFVTPTERRKLALKNALAVVQALRSCTTAELVERYSHDEGDAAFVEASARRVFAACDDEALTTLTVLIIGETFRQGFIDRPQPILALMTNTSNTTVDPSLCSVCGGYKPSPVDSGAKWGGKASLPCACASKSLTLRQEAEKRGIPVSEIIQNVLDE